MVNGASTPRIPFGFMKRHIKLRTITLIFFLFLSALKKSIPSRRSPNINEMWIFTHNRKIIGRNGEICFSLFTFFNCMNMSEKKRNPKISGRISARSRISGDNKNPTPTPQIELEEATAITIARQITHAFRMIREFIPSHFWERKKTTSENQ